jgi:hypothetical protein
VRRATHWQRSGVLDLEPCQNAWIVSRGPAESFTHHFGQSFVVVVTGTVLSISRGRRSTAIVLLVDEAWQALAGLVDRKTFESLPPGEV